jgi:hypothetical protein
MEDEGLTIAKAIKSHVAIAVNDGSFKEDYGTAAWVLEGLDSRGGIVGKGIAPGCSQDHSSYRSELSGIFSILGIVDKICSFYGISEGEQHLGVILSALNQAFSLVSIICPNEPSYDLLGVMKHFWVNNSPIQWKIRHVAGHQDDHTAVDKLD